MVRSTAWLLGALLGLICVLPPVLMTPRTAQCTSLKTLENKLIGRRRNMKHNLPINYTIRVHYEEVFKLSNITRLRVRVEDLEDGDLQDVWLLVNQEVLKRILRVLPVRHPSYKYTTDLEDLFRKVQQVFPPQSDEIVAYLTGGRAERDYSKPEKGAIVFICIFIIYCLLMFMFCVLIVGSRCV
ncbi:interleukin-34 isoform 2-T4 [Salvelinus alpinus]